MKYIWACSCGKHTECTRQDQQLGAVWHCEGCGKTFACVRPKKGGKVWISVADGDIEFHGLLEEPEPSED